MIYEGKAGSLTTIVWNELKRVGFIVAQFDDNVFILSLEKKITVVEIIITNEKQIVFSVRGYHADIFVDKVNEMKYKYGFQESLLFKTSN